MARSYEVYDVFTDKALCGNQLAVVHDGEGLDDAAMLTIAQEFNLSETVFVLPASNKAHTAHIRIFTPFSELPFAGHPTVGSAIALAMRNGGLDHASRMLVLEEKVGPVRCAVHGGDVPYAEFDLPRMPQPVECDVDAADIGAAMGLNVQDIGFENHEISAWNAGNSFVYVPVRGLAQAHALNYNASIWQRLAPLLDGKTPSVFVYCRDTVGHDCAFHGRMFFGEESREDPATGSAVASFAGVIQQFDGLAEGPNAYWIEQGIEMGRPSRIRLELDGRGGAIAGARIGGHAVKIAEGTLFA